MSVSNSPSPGGRLWAALAAECPLQVAGTVNAYSAILARHVGFRCIYLSGSGVASASLGIPDLGITTLSDVAIDVSRITSACELPLLVDIDTGWGSAFNIRRAIRELERSGAAAVHIEDQIAQKRCGHRPNKQIVSTQEMCDRIKVAVDAKIDSEFMVMARTDALAIEGINGVLERIGHFVEAGANGIFAEAMTDLSMYKEVVSVAEVPVLANMTEFGLTPLYDAIELASVGVAMALYPLSAFRAMSAAALEVYGTIRKRGSQKEAVPQMQTREDFYEILGYHEFERKIDSLFGEGSDNG